MSLFVQTKFNLPPGNESYILKSINKKWRSWKSYVKGLNFDPNTPIEEQMIDVPDRVDDDQYRTLIEHWMSDKSKVQYAYYLIHIKVALTMFQSNKSFIYDLLGSKSKEQRNSCTIEIVSSHGQKEFRTCERNNGKFSLDDYYLYPSIS